MINIPVLAGRFVCLVPLTQAHTAGLYAAAAADRSTYDLTTVPGSRGEMQAYVDRALAEHSAGRVVPFAVTPADTQHVAGTTRFMDIEC